MLASRGQKQAIVILSEVPRLFSSRVVGAPRDAAEGPLFAFPTSKHCHPERSRARFFLPAVFAGARRSEGSAFSFAFIRRPE